MGDAIWIFQEDSERRINSDMPGIMMLILQMKGQRVSGSYERNNSLLSLDLPFPTTL